MDPIIARKTFRTLEPLHGFIYFDRDASKRYVDAGLEKGRMGYFATRSAAMGPVPAEVVIATFYNFNPELVRPVIPCAWSLLSPDKVVAVRYAAVDAGLRAKLGDDAISSPELAEAAELARRAAEVACEHPEGRALFAGHAALEWPDAPHLVLWHAQTLLREFRGDAHVAALVLHGLSGIQALVSHAASGDVPAEALRTSRSWSEEEWAAAVEDMRASGLVETDGSFTEQGRGQRDAIEARTDAASAAAYEPLGEDGCERLRSLARPFSVAMGL